MERNLADQVVECSLVGRGIGVTPSFSADVARIVFQFFRLLLCLQFCFLCRLFSLALCAQQGIGRQIISAKARSIFSSLCIGYSGLNPSFTNLLTRLAYFCAAADSLAAFSRAARRALVAASWFTMKKLCIS